MARHFIRAAALMALAAPACGPSPVTLPEPPMADQTAAIVALYQMPTATLNTDNIQQVASDARAQLANIPVDWLPGVISDTLVSVQERLDGAGISQDPGHQPDRSRVQITAVIDLQRICKGWNDPADPPDQATNGAIDLTAVVDAGRLNPELWGTASACRTRFPPASGSSALSVIGSNPTVVNATIDGTLTIYALAPLPRTPADAQFWLGFQGTITVNGQSLSTSFDFEVANQSVSFRVPVNGGYAIVTVGATLGIQGANGGFSCDLSGGSCQST